MERVKNSAPVVKVTHGFVGNRTKRHLKLKYGETVSVIRKVKLNERGDWWEGFNSRDERGFFPDTCVDSSNLHDRDLYIAGVIDGREEAKRRQKGIREKVSEKGKVRIVVNPKSSLGTISVKPILQGANITYIMLENSAGNITNCASETIQQIFRVPITHNTNRDGVNDTGSGSKLIILCDGIKYTISISILLYHPNQEFVVFGEARNNFGLFELCFRTKTPASKLNRFTLFPTRFLSNMVVKMKLERFRDISIKLKHCIAVVDVLDIHGDVIQQVVSGIQSQSQSQSIEFQHESSLTIDTDACAYGFLRITITDRNSKPLFSIVVPLYCLMFQGDRKLVSIPMEIQIDIGSVPCGVFDLSLETSLLDRVKQTDGRSDDERVESQSSIPYATDLLVAAGYSSRQSRDSYEDLRSLGSSRQIESPSSIHRSYASEQLNMMLLGHTSIQPCDKHGNLKNMASSQLDDLLGTSNENANQANSIITSLLSCKDIDNQYEEDNENTQSKLEDLIHGISPGQDSNVYLTDNESESGNDVIRIYSRTEIDTDSSDSDEDLVPQVDDYTEELQSPNDSLKVLKYVKEELKGLNLPVVDEAYAMKELNKDYSTNIEIIDMQSVAETPPVIETELLDASESISGFATQQEYLEAVRRGLGGCLSLSRENVWKVVADIGLWTTVANELGDLRTDEIVKLPLLDIEALGATVNATGLALKQLHRGLIDSLQIDSMESEYDAQQKLQVERVAIGEAMDNKKGFYSTPLQLWDTSMLCRFLKCSNVDPSNFMELNICGADLFQIEQQGNFALEEGLKNLGINDELARQRLQFQISLAAIRSNSFDDSFSSKTSSILLNDTCWWAGNPFGLRVKVALQRWQVKDVVRFFRMMRFSHDALERIEGYAIDGKSLLELTPHDMTTELELEPKERELLQSSLLLLSRPPEISMGQSLYLNVRLQDHNNSIVRDGKIVLESSCVHRITLRPGSALIHAVNSTTTTPAVKIWFRLMEYMEPCTKVGWNIDNRNQKPMMSEAVSFSDQGCVSISSTMRQNTNASGSLQRWDPLHPLLQTRTGIVNGWRYLGTTSAKRGVEEECARMVLSFDPETLRKRDDGARCTYRICFAIQVESMDDYSKSKILKVPATIGEPNEFATHLFTLTEPFKVLNAKEILASKPVGKKKIPKKIIRRKVQTQNSVPPPPLVPSSPKQKPLEVEKPAVVHTTRPTRSKPVIYVDTSERDRMEQLELENSRIKEQLELLQHTDHKESDDDETRTVAAFHLGNLLGYRKESPTKKQAPPSPFSSDSSSNGRSSYNSSSSSSTSSGKSSPNILSSSSEEDNWIDDLITVDPVLEESDSEHDLDETQASLWAEKVKAKWFDKEEILTYPLRPNDIAPVLTSCIKTLRLAINQTSASGCIAALVKYDKYHRGWITVDHFFEFVNTLGHGDWDYHNIFSLLLENKETNHLLRDISSVWFVRYEAAILAWTHDEEAYIRAMSHRIMKVANSKCCDLAYLFKLEDEINLETLQIFDVDVNKNDHRLVSARKLEQSYLMSPFVRSNTMLFVKSVIYALQEMHLSSKSKVDLMVLFRQYDVESLGEVDLETLGMIVKQQLGVKMSTMELSLMCKSINGVDNIVRYNVLMDDHSCQFSQFNIDIAFDMLLSCDDRFAGRVGLEDMYQALCGAYISDIRQLAEYKKAQIRALALDFEKSNLQYAFWIGKRFGTKREKVFEFELFRLGKWLCAHDYTQDILKKITTQSSGTWIAPTILVRILHEYHFCGDFGNDFFHGLEMERNGMVNYEALFHKSIQNCDCPETQKLIDSLSLSRLVQSDFERILLELENLDFEGTGVLPHDVFTECLNVNVSAFKSFSFHTGVVLYEDVLLNAISNSPDEDGCVRMVIASKIRRAGRRCSKLQERPLLDLFHSVDETNCGALPFGELLWQLRSLDVDVPDDGKQAQYLVDTYGSSRCIDYEKMLLECNESEKKDFLGSILYRCFKLENSITGMFHLYDSQMVGSEVVEHMDEGGSSCYCTVNRLKDAFAICFPGVLEVGSRKTSDFFKFAVELYSSSNGGLFRYAAFAVDMNEEIFRNDQVRKNQDQTRHTVVSILRIAEFRSVNLYDIMRAFDADLDGQISLRNLNKALHDALGTPKLDEAAVRLVLPHSEDPEIVMYEEFVEQARYLLQGKLSYTQLLSPPRLQSVLRRINTIIIRAKELSTARQVFTELLLQSNESDDDKCLTEWDIFYLLREHSVRVFSIEDILLSLKVLLQASSCTSIQIYLSDWLKLVYENQTNY